MSDPQTSNQSNVMSKYDPLFVPHSFGLNNNGAICWANSLFQSLLSCSQFNKKMLHYANDIDLIHKPVAQEYIRLLRVLGLPRDNSTPVVLSAEQQTYVSNVSMALVVAMCREMIKKGKRIAFGNQQECVSEALIHFIDLIDFKPIENVFKTRFRKLIPCEHCGEVVSSQFVDSLYIEYIAAPDQEDLAENFVARIKTFSSKLDDYKCDKCHVKMNEAYRIESLCMLREVVIIMFKVKFISKPLTYFPTELVFNSTSGNNLVYNLVSQIEHSGSRHGGHYWCISKREQGNIKMLNDLGVNNAEQTPTTQTFMLFYNLV